jgi:transposase-like protein
VRAGHRRPGVQEAGACGHRRFFTRALEHGTCPTEVSTGCAPPYPRAVEELMPAACHIVEQYADNPIEADHRRLKGGCDRCAGSNECARHG